MWLTVEQKQRIVNHSIEYFQSLDFGHGINHLRRTVKIAQMIAKKERADIELVTFGAMLHQFHEPVEVEKFLRSIGVRSDAVRKLTHCVESIDRKGVKNVKTIEAKIVFDADKLQVLGPFGTVRELTSKVCANGGNFEEAIREVLAYQVDIINNYLQTKTARYMAKEITGVADDFLASYQKWFNLGQNEKLPFLDEDQKRSKRVGHPRTAASWNSLHFLF